MKKTSEATAMSTIGSFPSELLDVKERLQAAIDAGGEAPVGFDIDQWLREWLELPQPALGGDRPIQLLDTAEGRVSVRRALGSLLSGAYQ
jgi:uncharacterized protein (DUF2384 family)